MSQICYLGPSFYFMKCLTLFLQKNGMMLPVFGHKIKTTA